MKVCMMSTVMILINVWNISLCFASNHPKQCIAMLRMIVLLLLLLLLLIVDSVVVVVAFVFYLGVTVVVVVVGVERETLGARSPQLTP